MRKFLGAVLVAAAAGMPPPAEAQVLQTFCDSADESWCFNATAFDYVKSVSAFYPDEAYFQWDLAGFWTGDAFTGLSNLVWGFWVRAPDFNSSGYSWNSFLPDAATTGLNTYTDGVDPSYVPTLGNAAFEFRWADAGGSGAVRSCTVNTGSGSACHTPTVSVSEPGTMLLMLSGILGLGWVRWRREGESMT